MTTHAAPQLPCAEGEFRQQFSSTRRGARLARQLALYQLSTWGIPHTMTVFDAAEIVVGELAANAVTHGCVAGRDFEVMMRLRDATLRIEVSDTRTERRPPGPGALTPPPELGESGRGLLLVEALADRWSVRDRVPVGKTVRAELDIPLPPVRPRTRD
ncbi:ATP-binding protein [Streptomyces sp. NPDC021224]|uniref:ATP-binding protein n=1 Tax=unclassified Streptomyces TaxID=2593676 RepID=UPI0037A5F595